MMSNSINEKGCDISQNVGAFILKAHATKRTKSIYFLLLCEILIEIIPSRFCRTMWYIVRFVRSAIIWRFGYRSVNTIFARFDPIYRSINGVARSGKNISMALRCAPISPAVSCQNAIRAAFPTEGISIK